LGGTVYICGISGVLPALCGIDYNETGCEIYDARGNSIGFQRADFHLQRRIFY
jgi:hypothetical protein